MFASIPSAQYKEAKGIDNLLMIQNVTEESIAIQICLFAFDILYFNGENIVGKPLSERRVILRENFNFLEGKFATAVTLDSSDTEEIQGFLEQSIKDNCEGLMVKTVDSNSSYEPSKRSRNWLKLKKDYLSGVGDSLDLVVIGGYFGIIVRLK